MRAMLALFLGLFLGGCASRHPELPTVLHVNLERYAGTWYEIARYENRFEKGCVGASATYTQEGERLRVVNRCFDAQGTQIGEAKGVAKLASPFDTSKLKVSFFRPFYGNYWVLKLASDYRYAVIGEPSRQYFWILAREKALHVKDKEEILAHMKTLGYNLEKLFWTRYP
ncbi:MAG: lipocalin family protein [Campylobacterales bacterium]|nr:lipocalin family protein [Campylobacterales bacterium]